MIRIGRCDNVEDATVLNFNTEDRFAEIQCFMKAWKSRGNSESAGGGSSAEAGDWEMLDDEGPAFEENDTGGLRDRCQKTRKGR